MNTQPDRDDLPFRHYSAKHRCIAWVSQNIFQDVTYVVRHGLLTGMKRKGGLGFLPEFLWKGTETAEIRFWRNVDLDGGVVYDVGAFHGLLTLFFATRARQVIAYEPNAKNRERLIENINLNRITNVTLRPVGLGAAEGTATMVFDPLMPGGASAEQATKDQLLKAVRGAVTEEIRITTLDIDQKTERLPAPDLIKIDIEGFELDALQGARTILETYRPALYIELHGETMNEKRRKTTALVSFLEEVGYRTIRHVESGTDINASNASIRCEGHLYCPRPDGHETPERARRSPSGPQAGEHGSARG
jgi:FkbM family methyltransferase